MSETGAAQGISETILFDFYAMSSRGSLEADRGDLHRWLSLGLNGRLSVACVLNLYGHPDDIGAARRGKKAASKRTAFCIRLVAGVGFEPTTFGL